MSIVDEILSLKKERQAVILAHNYQPPQVQDIADQVGDSLELSRAAARLDCDVIIFCGVDFMAETAAILSPQKTVVLPAKGAWCPMAHMIAPEELRDLKALHPRAAAVCYVNSTAEIKAESDICCTSANALKVVDSLPDKEVIFVPDRNLGQYVARFSDKTFHFWNGFCPTHERLKAVDVERLKRDHPEALFVCHPECNPAVVALADHVCSTTGMYGFCKESSATRFIIAGVLMLSYCAVSGKSIRYSPLQLTQIAVVGDEGVTREDSGTVLGSVRPYRDRPVHPMHQVLADSMAPAHGARAAINDRSILVEQVILALVINRTVRIIDPALGSSEVVLRPEGVVGDHPLPQG